MWWQWILGFIALVVILGSNLATAWVTAKVLRGEQLTLRKTKPPSPTYEPPEVVNEKIRQMRRDSVQQNVRILE